MSIVSRLPSPLSPPHGFKCNSGAGLSSPVAYSARLSALQPSASPCGSHGNGWTSGLRASRSEEHTSELQSLMRISYAVFCLKKTHHNTNNTKKPTARIHE